MSGKVLILSGRQRFPAEIALGHFMKRPRGEEGWVKLTSGIRGARWPTLDVVGGVYRDRLVLKMTSEQINEGQERVEKVLASPRQD